MSNICDTLADCKECYVKKSEKLEKHLRYYIRLYSVADEWWEEKQQEEEDRMFERLMSD
jgi:hypothetical protein